MFNIFIYLNGDKVPNFNSLNLNELKYLVKKNTNINIRLLALKHIEKKIIESRILYIKQHKINKIKQNNNLTISTISIDSIELSESHESYKSYKSEKTNYKKKEQKKEQLGMAKRLYDRMVGEASFRNNEYSNKIIKPYIESNITETNINTHKNKKKLGIRKNIIS